MNISHLIDRCSVCTGAHFCQYNMGVFQLLDGCHLLTADYVDWHLKTTLIKHTHVWNDQTLFYCF